MPPGDGSGSDEELLAKVIPLRRRGDTAHDPDCSTPRPLGAEAEPRDSEKFGPPDRSTPMLEHSIWDPPTLELPRRPTAARRRLRRVLEARVPHLHGLPAGAIATAGTGAIAIAALAFALSVFERGGSPQQGGSVLHASVIGGSHVKSANAHSTTARRSATTTGVHRHRGAGAQHRPASSNRVSSTAQSTHVSTGESTGTTVVSDEGLGSSAGSSSLPAITTATEERSTTEASTSPSATYSPVATAQAPSTQSRPKEGTEAKSASSEFGFER